jgi:ferredoxin--NADP+ reductase
MQSCHSAAAAYKVAIVGSGPSGFYAAEALLESSPDIEISMIERLPVPFGLVRHGVAPDHPKLKQPIAIFEAIARSPRLHLLCNVKVGEDLDVRALLDLHHAVILAYGAESDCELGIPGENLPGSHAATEFVGWYNAHPDYRDRVFDLSRDAVAVIGNGNVALDIARLLAKTPDELRHTDIASYALDALAESRVKEIHIIGRRGPAQAKFSPQELQEFGRLSDCQPDVAPADLNLNDASQTEVADKMSRAIMSNMRILREFTIKAPDSRRRRCVFHFLQSPVAILGGDRVRSLRLIRNLLRGGPFRQIPVPSGEFSELPVGLVFRSVGNRAAPIRGIPFDLRNGVLPTHEGRVIDDVGKPLLGIYATGWAKRGPSGTIGTNRAESANVVATLLKDLPLIGSAEKLGGRGLQERLRDRHWPFVDYCGWQKIDRAEIENGRSKGKPREKFARIDEMLCATNR